MNRVGSCLALALLALAAPVRAESAFNIRAYGRGFTDSTPVEPVGGNTGKTLGEQRKLALEYAANIWGKLLDSNVPVEVRVDFTEMGCGDDGFTLASASTAGMVVFDSEPIGDANTAYPYALASRLAGYDVDPALHDIDMNVNTSVDDERCSSPSLRGFYYGLDGRGPNYLIDLVSTALHELGHGLGFLSLVSRQDGAPMLTPELDVYSTHVRDLALDRSWRQLSGAQRVQSLKTPRGVVFDGLALNAAAGRLLTQGTPTLTLSPIVPGFVGLVADTGFAGNPALTPVKGEVVELALTAGCTGLLEPQRAAGKIPFINFGSYGCRASEVAQAAQQAGALGVLLPYVSSGDIPQPLPAGVVQSTLPVVVVSEGDAQLLHTALQRNTLTASLAGDANQRLGADKKGRVLLFTPDEVASGSSLSHFDVSARPDLLMEPFMSTTAPHDVDLTLALLRDLGWTSLCGNGAMDYGEECDAAQQNGDGADAPCRSSCLLPGCGDGLPDADEACDDGRDNSDILPGACRTECKLASCGDGVVDPDEQCDDGMQTAKCTAACTLFVAPVDAGVASREDAATTPAGDAATADQEGEPVLRPWGQATLEQTRKRADDGCGLTRGSSSSVWANLLLLIACVWLRRRR